MASCDDSIPRAYPGVGSHTCSKALQVVVRSADIEDMTDYQRMSTAERTRHHNELVDEGYEWCPECGETLVWEPPAPCRRSISAGDAPVIAGDCPPLTRDQLAATVAAL